MHKRPDDRSQVLAQAGELPIRQTGFNQADTEQTMKRLADEILPDFSETDFAE